MSRRSWASVLVFVLLLALCTLAVFLPVPFVTMSPGPTVNVLGKEAAKGPSGSSSSTGSRPVIEVQGHRTYPTRGELRLTTVSVTSPDRHIGLAEALGAWLDRTRAVYPRDVIYPPTQSVQDVEQQGSVEMVGSQDTAVAAALTELGYKLPLQVEVLAVDKGAPADGKLRTRDRILAVDGTKITQADQVSRAVQRAKPGTPVELTVRRGSQTRTVRVTPKPSTAAGGKPVVGVRIGTGYDFPFDVSVKLGNDIGGPSAGLIFSLGVYDTLTPGALTGGKDIAGTGTIDQAGRVGPIGGIQQKIVAAADAGAKVFLVPPANCQAALGADVTKDEIELVKAPTLHSAVQSLKAYAKNPSADLPSCR